MYRPKSVRGLLCLKSRECAKSKNPKSRDYSVILNGFVHATCGVPLVKPCACSLLSLSWKFLRVSESSTSIRTWLSSSTTWISSVPSSRTDPSSPFATGGSHTCPESFSYTSYSTSWESWPLRRPWHTGISITSERWDLGADIFGPSHSEGGPKRECFETV